MRRAETAGFTLLEMLVALVVFGLLMAGVAQAMRYGMTAWTAETRRAAAPETAAAVDAALRRLIEQASPDTFTGEPGQMSFTAPLPAGSGLADPQADMALLVAPGDRLTLRYTPHPAGVRLGPPVAARSEVLLEDVTSIRARYLVSQPDGSIAWSDHWSGTGLPLLVRIGFRFAGAETWPDLVVAPAGMDPQ